MPVRFQSTELIPAPFVEIQKGFSRTTNGKALSPQYTFTLTGTIVNVDSSKDSPDSALYTGANGPTMEGIIAEQKRIRRLFASTSDGGRLEIETPGGGGPNTIDAYCTVESINFAPGTWVDRCPYTIVLRANKIENDPEPVTGLSAYTESWNISENEDGTYGVSHQIQATGETLYGPLGTTEGLQVARSWCQTRMTSISSVGAITINGSGYNQTLLPITDFATNYWNLGVTESIGVTDNSWQISENFVYAPSGSAREEFSASLNYEGSDITKVSVSVNGSVIGFASRNSNYLGKIANAKTKFTTSVEPNIISRVTVILPTGYTLNPIPSTKQITYEENAGLLRYSYTFSAAQGTLISGATEETININDTGTTDIFAQIQIPGRANGPVIQNMKTVTLPERTVSITATIAGSGVISAGTLTAAYLAKPNVDALIASLKPNVGYYYIKQNSEEWNPIRRQYARTISWTIQPEGLPVSGIPVGINNESPN